MDTSVLVAAFRSPVGASAAIVQTVLSGRFRPLVSVPLVLEYESVLLRPEHLAVSGFTVQQAVSLVKAFCKMGEPVHLAYRLRPQLQDPNDEFILETAFHGRADGIVTFNSKDFQPAAKSLGIETLLPAGAWKRMNGL